LAHEEEKGLYKGRILIPPPVPFHSWTDTQGTKGRKKEQTQNGRQCRIKIVKKEKEKSPKRRRRRFRFLDEHVHMYKTDGQ
jgi:hypothetical protein